MRTRNKELEPETMPSTPLWVSSNEYKHAHHLPHIFVPFSTFFWLSSLPLLLNKNSLFLFWTRSLFSLPHLEKAKLKCLEFVLSTNMKISVKILKELTKSVHILGPTWQSLETRTGWYILEYIFRNACPADMGIQERWPVPVICRAVSQTLNILQKEIRAFMGIKH